MCIELHKQSAEALEMFRAIEDESKFVPSQFSRGSIADVMRDGMTKMHAEGFELAKVRVLRLLLAVDLDIYTRLYQQIEELKP